MSSRRITTSPPSLVAEWPLPSSATLGSALRAKGLERTLRRRVPWAVRKCVTVEAGRISLCMPEAEGVEFSAVSERISKAHAEIAEVPILPSELEDILSISARERHKWLKDGRLKSMGTRTVKLRGRAKAVTFHVFDPRIIEELLDGDLAAIWREEDAQALAEGRRRAAGKAARARADKGRRGDTMTVADDEDLPLDGWEEFEADGLLR